MRVARCALRVAGGVVLLLLLPAPLFAGLHYSGEQWADLPSQWRGLLLDQRALRLLAVPPVGDQPRLLRDQYLTALDRLEAAARKRLLTADEQADHGALLLRLGRLDDALAGLRKASAAHPDHFRIAANLGTAWHSQGDLDRAAEALRLAVRLAPATLKPAEELHLKLVRSRLAAPKATGLDDLFGVDLTAPASRRKLTLAQLAQVQQLALWLPADGRLLWQLSEWANLGGDLRTAAGILDGCVTEFGMGDATLRARRRTLRALADKPDAAPHADHAAWKMRSPRPLRRAFDLTKLPPVQAKGVNLLPWDVVTLTTTDRQAKPTFPKYLEQLDGKSVRLTGFLQPLGDDLEAGSFLLLEYPVGCWFCETPEPMAIVLIELPEGKSVPLKRGQVNVEGTLRLNRRDPEDFLYTLHGAGIRSQD